MLNLRNKIPTILTSEEILDKAFRRVVKIEKEGDTKLEMVKRKSVARISAATDILKSTLIKYVRVFPSINARDDFLAEIVDVVISVDKLKKALNNVEWAAGKVGEMQKLYVARISKSRTVEEMDTVRKAYYGRVSAIVNKIDPDLKFLAFARNEFRKIPDFDPNMTTIVVAGFPNVGKSQFLKAISTAEPEIAPYPFTTKGIAIGHFQKGWRRYQMIDTPGLLDRELEQRNKIELQAILALKHLATAMVFILDPSETSGYHMDRQLALLESIKENFPDLPLLVLENKVDLLRSDSDRIKMSAAKGEGLDEAIEAIIEMLKPLEKDLPAY